MTRHKEADTLQDMCRQLKRMPNLFFTIAPAQWKFDWHRGLHEWRKRTGETITDAQASFTIHLHHVIGTILREVVLKKGKVTGNSAQELLERKAAGIEEVEEFCFRWEYQGRGTLHVHVLAWVKFSDEVFGGNPGPGIEYDPSVLNGRPGKPPANPALLTYLQS